MADTGELPVLPRYDLDGGVCNSASPIHIADSQLTNAQNAQFDLAGSLRKRDGLSAFTSALGGSILGAMGVPLPDPNSSLITDTGTEITQIAVSPGDIYLVTSITRSGGTVTVTVTTTIWFLIGFIITIAGCDGATTAYNGSWTVVSIPTPTTFTFTIGGTPNTPATGSAITVAAGSPTGGAVGGWLSGTGGAVKDGGGGIVGGSGASAVGAGQVAIPTIMIGHAVNPGAPFWSLSADGATWFSWAGPGVPVGFDVGAGAMFTPLTVATGTGQTHLWWIYGESYGNLYWLYHFDGRTWAGTRIPADVDTTTLVSALTAHEDKLYMVRSENTGRGVVLSFDPVTGQFAQVGSAFKASTTGCIDANGPAALISFGGRLWVGTAGVYPTFLTKVFSILVESTTADWVQEVALANTEGSAQSFASFNGTLYLGTYTQYSGSYVSTGGSLWKRTSETGLWGQVDDGIGQFGAAVNGDAGGYSYLTVANGKLWAAYFLTHALGNQSVIRVSSNGTSWSTEVDLQTLTSTIPGVTGATVINGISYVPAQPSSSGGFILARSAAGVWSIARDETATGIPIAGAAIFR